MSVQSFIPKVWSARLIQHLDNALVARSFFNRNYEGEIRNYGDTVVINQIGRPTIKTYVPNTDMDPPEDAEATGQEMPIDQADYFFFQVDDVDAAQMRTSIMDDKMQGSAFELADTEDRYLFGLLDSQALPANRITAPLSTANDIYRLLIRMRTMMKRNNVPTNGRIIALPPEAIALLLEDDRFMNTGSVPAETRLQSGFITRALGFDIFESNNLPDDNRIIASHSMASTYANQIVKTEALRLERRFADAVKGLSVYGARVIIPQAVVVAEVTIS